jgi:high affinity Mn2+ porin
VHARPTLAILAVLALLGLPRGVAAAPPALSPPSDSALPPEAATAPAGEAPESWAIHGQATSVWQYHPAFTSRIPPGPQSLDSGSRGNETLSATLYGGVRLWPGAEAWVNPEIDQGFGLSNTHGLAGFSNGESFKIGSNDPYVKLQRLFLRQTINLGGATEKREPDLNVLGGTQSENRLVVTIGKFSIVDIFDTNKYAHDPRDDFMNWAIIDSAAFDSASDAWNFTVGAAAEWYQDWWTIRTGLFDGTPTPGGEYLATPLGQQSQGVVELEARYGLFGQPGSAKLLAFGTRARLASYDDAIAQGQSLDEPATTDGVRRLRNKGGVVLNIAQQLREDLGVFLRAGLQDGRLQSYSYADVSQSVSAGVSLAGTGWGRPDDTVGVAGVINLASRPLRAFLAAGGLGIIIGDGQLPASGPEQIAEAFYCFTVTAGVRVTADYQFVNNPAYDRTRGPVSIFAARLHVEF